MVLRSKVSVFCHLMKIFTHIVVQKETDTFLLLKREWKRVKGLEKKRNPGESVSRAAQWKFQLLPDKQTSCCFMWCWWWFLSEWRHLQTTTLTVNQLSTVIVNTIEEALGSLKRGEIGFILHNASRCLQPEKTYFLQSSCVIQSE